MTVPKRAVVLAAGQGTRLGALTAQTPKPMLDVGGPIIDHILSELARAGFVDVGVNLHFGGDVIRDHVGDGGRFGLRVHYVVEPDLRGTAGGVHGLAQKMGPGPLLVHYGDIVTNHNLDQLWSKHVDDDAAVTLLVHERAGSNSILTLDGDHVVGFVERPQQTSTNPHWVFSGIAVLSAPVVEGLPATGDLPRDVFVPLVDGDAAVFAQRLVGERVAVDSPARLEQARATLAKIRASGSSRR